METHAYAAHLSDGLITRKGHGNLIFNLSLCLESKEEGYRLVLVTYRKRIQGRR